MPLIGGAAITAPQGMTAFGMPGNMKGVRVSRRGHGYVAGGGMPGADDMIRLIGPDGSQAGIVAMGAARTMAAAAGLDAVVVSRESDPPVVRLEDSGKRKYEEEKKRRRSRRNSRGGSKEIRLTVDIGDHDLDTKTRQAAAFLDKGTAVQLTMIMKGRKQSRPMVAADRLRSIASSLTDGGDGRMMSPMSRNGNRITCVITPAHGR